MLSAVLLMVLCGQTIGQTLKVAPAPGPVLSAAETFRATAIKALALASNIPTQSPDSPTTPFSGPAMVRHCFLCAHANIYVIIGTCQYAGTEIFDSLGQI